MGIAIVAVGLNTFYGGVLFGVLLKLKFSHNMHLLRSLQKCQGSGIAERPLRRVDVSFEVWARTAEQLSHTVLLAWLMQVKGVKCHFFWEGSSTLTML